MHRRWWALGVNWCRTVGRLGLLYHTCRVGHSVKKKSFTRIFRFPRPLSPRPFVRHFLRADRNAPAGASITSRVRAREHHTTAFSGPVFFFAKKPSGRCVRRNLLILLPATQTCAIMHYYYTLLLYYDNM